MRRAVATVVALGALAGAVSAAATRIDGPAAGTAAAVRTGPPVRALVLGDSALAALRWAPGSANAVVGFDRTLDVEPCRRLAEPSCPGRGGRPPTTALEALAVHGDAYDLLVLAVGYNELPSQMADSFARVVARARSLGYRQVVWWTLRNRGPSTNAGRNDRTIRDLVAGGGYPDVVIADWAAYSAGRPDWFAADGVHYSLTGAYAAADYLSRTIASLEARVCPLPPTPTAPPSVPCPDPDTTGPVADLRALYRIGTESVICFEQEVDAVRCQLYGLGFTIRRALGPGDAGAEVDALQQRLRRLGLVASVTGVVDAVTSSALQAFQRSRALPSSGVADRSTLAALGFDVSGVA
jgi:hypothetical protein